MPENAAYEGWSAGPPERITDLTFGELTLAYNALRTALAREDAGPPLIGNADLRVCLTLVSTALNEALHV